MPTLPNLRKYSRIVTVLPVVLLLAGCHDEVPPSERVPTAVASPVAPPTPAVRPIPAVPVARATAPVKPLVILGPPPLPKSKPAVKALRTRQYRPIRKSGRVRKNRLVRRGKRGR